jgi:phenylacetate-CoA ligase
MIWDVYHECMDMEERRELQLHRLREVVARVQANVPLYRDRFAEIGFGPEDVKTLEDIRHVPFTMKDDLRETYPFGLFARPLSETVRIHCSSGTTGKPIVAGYTRSDIEMWAETIARTLCCGGAVPHDILQNGYGYGLFTGGLGLHYGAELMGVTVIPVSGGNTKRQITIMQDFGTTLLSCTPSYALTLAEAVTETGLEPGDLKLRSGYFGAEPWSEEARVVVEERLGVKAYDIYGLTEIIGPGVSAECEAQHGLHICDDHFYPEIINPETGEPLPEGELGELVFTCLTKEAFPVLRYRTRDICSLIYEPCACGRTAARMTRLAGRTDDMLIIRGINVFPSQIENVLLGIKEAEPHYHLVVTREGHLDQLEVHVEVSEDIFSDRMGKLDEVRGKIQGEIESVLGLRTVVKLVEPKSIERSEGKAKRVTDLREGV